MPVRCNASPVDRVLSRVKKPGSNERHGHGEYGVRIRLIAGTLGMDDWLRRHELQNYTPQTEPRVPTAAAVDRGRTFVYLVLVGSASELGLEVLAHRWNSGLATEEVVARTTMQP